jgi:hypothetical protein
MLKGVLVTVVASLTNCTAAFAQSDSYSPSGAPTLAAPPVAPTYPSCADPPHEQSYICRGPNGLEWRSTY